jgi:hypothetical protein
MTRRATLRFTWLCIIVSASAAGIGKIVGAW